MSTDRQLVANGRNALLSTGPIDTGATRLNAVNHGIMSAEVLIRTGDNREDASELDRLSAGLSDQLSPDGALEELLFDQIVPFAWHWRRAIRYESARFASRTSQAVARYVRDEPHRDGRAFYGFSFEGSGRGIGGNAVLDKVAQGRGRCSQQRRALRARDCECRTRGFSAVCLPDGVRGIGVARVQHSGGEGNLPVLDDCNEALNHPFDPD
jgi:hypothetical protein